jgi:hypothetical protein
MTDKVSVSRDDLQVIINSLAVTEYNKAAYHRVSLALLQQPAAPSAYEAMLHDAIHGGLGMVRVQHVPAEDFKQQPAAPSVDANKIFNAWLACRALDMGDHVTIPLTQWEALSDAIYPESASQQPAAPDLSGIGMRDGKYVDCCPQLNVGGSAFEDWYQAHPKACTGDKQLARDAYVAGMGDPSAAAFYRGSEPQQPDPRTQLLQFVPPVGEWPEWATYYVAKGLEGQVGFVGDHWRSVDGDIVFTRAEVMAARGGA